VNEPLWSALADDFLAHQYDFKHLVRTILISRTYQSSPTPNATNASDRLNFSHAQFRRLSAEQLLDALTQATGMHEPAGFPPGQRAAQVATVHTQSYLLKVFGRPLRKTACTCERSSHPTLPQVLHLLNGATIQESILAPGGRLEQLLAANLSNDQLIEELYLHVLSRPPDDRERRRAEDYFADSTNRAEGAEDLMWALLNSRQFVFNY
jgi:hypothetical protein